MDILLPCLNRLKKTDSTAGPFDISFGASPGGIATDVEFAALAVDLAIAILQPELFLVFPFMPFGWDWAFSLLGLGPSDIEIQKMQIQAYYNPVFKMLAKGYGFPLRQGKALKVSSDYVKVLLGKRPDLAAEAPLMQDEADRIVTGSFGYDKSGPGIRQRMVNQYLANASYNGWPLQASIDAWKAIVAASTCPPPPKQVILPSAPGNLVATPGNERVNLGWSRAQGTSENPSKTFVYSIKRSQTQGGPYIVVGNTPGITYTDSGLTDDQQYCYTVSATSAVGEGADSNEACATPFAPPPTRPCPPGYDMARCFEICGQIRQLTAGQLALGPELTSIMGYFQDCIMPPDGSWRYIPPPIDGAINVFPASTTLWLPSGTTLGDVDPTWYPYRWDPNIGQIRVVIEAPADSPYPPGTMVVRQANDYHVVVLPDGTVDCWGNMKPPPDTEPPPEPEPPPPSPPPPDPIPAWGQQLRSDFETLQQDYSQFKQTVYLGFDSLKRAVWQGFIRSNYQASEVYAKDQAGWQGDNPPAEQPAYPASWQDLPTPGTPQVLEIPPIQQYPQVLEIPVVDIAGLQQQLDDLRAQEQQINAQIEALQAQIPADIGAAIQTYNTDTVQPEFQQIRQDCCQPTTTPGTPQPEPACNEGKRKWGIMAECWLEANTEPIDDPLADVRAAWSEDAILSQVSRLGIGQFTSDEQVIRAKGQAAFDAGVNGQFSNFTDSLEVAQRGWIYSDPAIPEEPPVVT